jgi:adenosylhomocysteine nucleosidase
VSERFNVNGIMNAAGNMTVSDAVVGSNPVRNVSPSDRERQAARDADNQQLGLGVITILPEETHALVLALQLHATSVGGLRFYEAEVRLRGSTVKVAAIQALGPGQRSTMSAYARMHEYYNPRTVALVGIGGGIHRSLRPGDVVVATRVIYYDLRKETPDGVWHRGEEREAPAETGHAVNAFFADHEPAEFPVADPAGATRIMRMRAGLIGSGEAVIANHDAEILRYLASFNDKVLAVDTEAGGLALACHEQSATTGRLHGWAVVRGISDDAGAGKNDDYHQIASWHAAIALRELLPYLPASAPEPRVSENPRPGSDQRD